MKTTGECGIFILFRQHDNILWKTYTGN